MPVILYLLLLPFYMFRPPSPQSVFLDEIDDLRQQYHIPGMAVAVVKEQNVILTEGLGVADIEKGTAVNFQTSFRIASITKPIASTVLLQLEMEGEICLDQSIKSAYPEMEALFTRVKNHLTEKEPEWLFLVENYDIHRDDITIRHHLTHTSEFEPGSRYQYNGFLYGTLSRAMAQASEQSFPTLLYDRVFLPVNMKESLPAQGDPSRPEVIERLARPYRWDSVARRHILSPYPQQNVTAGAGIVSTIGDLARFDIALDQGKLLPDSVLTKAWTANRTIDGKVTPYGLGWFVGEMDGEKILWHTGWQPEAFSGLYLKFPERNMSLILLANSEGLSAPFQGQGYGEDVMVSPFARAFARLTTALHE
ncbi:MAG: serine hydrolase domain-containing protein [Bacteroidota bacterium]